MAEHLGDALYSMVSGQVRWERDADVLAAKASAHEARSLLEFLVGRGEGGRRKAGDVWPTDYVPGRQPSTEDEMLRGHIDALDKRMAHLSLARAAVPEDRPER